MGKRKEPGALPNHFTIDLKALDDIISKEKQTLLVKMKGIKGKLKECGMDYVVVPLSTDVSTKEEVQKILYGKYIQDEDNASSLDSDNNDNDSDSSSGGGCWNDHHLGGRGYGRGGRGRGRGRSGRGRY